MDGGGGYLLPLDNYRVSQPADSSWPTEERQNPGIDRSLFVLYLIILGRLQDPFSFLFFSVLSSPSRHPF